MTWKFLRRHDAGADADRISPAGHCLILTLIALAAIAASILLPATEPPAVAGRAQTASARGTAAAAARQAGAAQPAPRADVASKPPFEYFPAQFPSPSGDAGEQAPTF